MLFFKLQTRRAAACQSYVEGLCDVVPRRFAVAAAAPTPEGPIEGSSEAPSGVPVEGRTEGPREGPYCEAPCEAPIEAPIEGPMEGPLEGPIDVQPPAVGGAIEACCGTNSTGGPPAQTLPPVCGIAPKGGASHAQAHWKYSGRGMAATMPPP